MFTSLPSLYGMILIVLKHRTPFPTTEEAIHNLLQEETTTGLTKELGDATTWAARFSLCTGYRG
jgi:hypothetical protein